MRLIAGKTGGIFYTVFHVPTCKILKGVIWVDDVTAEWVQHVQPLHPVHGALLTSMHQAERIYINTENKVVLIDPIQFSLREMVFHLNEIPAPAQVGA
jgi:hypothetical protein